MGALGAISGKDVWGLLAVVVPLLGIGKAIEIVITHQVNKWKERAAERRADSEEGRDNSSYWQGQAMTLETELKKRDERIAALEASVEDLKSQLRDLQVEFADVLRENRRMRITLEERGQVVAEKR